MSPSNEEEVEDLLAPVVHSLREGLGNSLIAVALFGSRVRGDARAESDWDLLLIAHRLPKRPLQRHFFLKSFLPDYWRGRVSILAKMPDEFQSWLPSLYLDIALDARILYDPQGYLSQHLIRLRNEIVRQGLRRDRSNGGWIWRWQKELIRWPLLWEDIP